MIFKFPKAIAATHLRCRGKTYMRFAENVLLFAEAKKLKFDQESTKL